MIRDRFRRRNNRLKKLSKYKLFNIKLLVSLMVMYTMELLWDNGLTISLHQNFKTLFLDLLID